jgi:hypothetical protein
VNIVIDCVLAANAVFEDPLVRVQGIDAIRGQFIGLKKLFPSYEPLEFQVSWGFNGQPVIESVFRTRMPLIPITVDIKQFTKLTLNDEGKIVKHEDFWSFYDLIRNIRVLEWIDSFRKNYFGSASSYLFLKLSKTSQAKPQVSAPPPAPSASGPVAASPAKAKQG